MKKLNILNLATTDQGGAGNASKYLNDLFNFQGNNSVLVVKQSRLKNNNVIPLWDYSYRHPIQIINRFIYFLFRLINQNQIGPLDKTYSFFNIKENQRYDSAKKILKCINFKPDIIVIHWVTYFINSKTIKELQDLTNAKLFWIMMDNASFTGGCHYPWNCEGYQNNCSDCPAILLQKNKYVSVRNLTIKKKYLPHNIEIITCSEFDYRRVEKSSLFINLKIHKIILPVDELKFIPGEKKTACKIFGIPENIKVILYGSLSLMDIRTGGKYFFEALSFLNDKNGRSIKNKKDYIILMIGNGEIDAIKDLQIPIIQTGFLNEDKLIIAYQAADVFVSTSVEDSGPLMINQSIMCGTPVVAFEMGVALDLVVTRETGYIAKLRDSSDLANGIKYVLDLNEHQYDEMCTNCRRTAMLDCNSKKQVDKYINIF